MFITHLKLCTVFLIESIFW